MILTDWLIAVALATAAGPLTLVSGLHIFRTDGVRNLRVRNLGVKPEETIQKCSSRRGYYEYAVLMQLGK